VQALGTLGNALEAYPFVVQILQRALPSGWPNKEERKLLLADLLVEGAPVRSPYLRLTIDQIQNAMTAVLDQNRLIRRNTIVRQLQDIENLTQKLTQKQKRKAARKTRRTQA